jgi:pyruvate,orthophosphate dikinase
MGRPAVTGAAKVHIDVRGRRLRLPDGQELGEGDFIAINGSTGEITTDDVPVIAPDVSSELDTVLGWADELRHLGVRANADDAESATRAVELGAEGIGLCRSEHMFLGNRTHLMADVILADDDEARAAAIERLYPLQEDDYAAILEAMDGRPVCVRLLDPPLNEFLPDPDELPEGSDERKRVEALEEENPMLGTRGVRLGILQPDLYEMQVRALFRAAKRVPGANVEVMVPLVDYELELEFIRERVLRVAAEEGASDWPIGSMIELPRSCFVADRIAEQAEFFSFGTNDLTQTGLGFSREDIEARILERYIEVGILDRSPFETIDEPGVGQLVRMGAWLGRKARPKLKIGICGEHGGDPESIAFFAKSGIDYVSCSPPRVPGARLAAAQAAIRELS